MIGEGKAVAEKIGIANGTLNKYRAKTSTASMVNAAVIAEAAGLSLEWVATGKGEKLARKATALSIFASTGVDPILMEKLYKAVERVYRDAGQRPPGHRIANEATELLNLLLEKVTDIRDELVVDAVIPVLAQQLVERLAQAAAEPGTGKRSAS